MALMPKGKSTDSPLKQVYSKKAPVKQQAACKECGMKGCKCEEPSLGKSLPFGKKK